MKVAISRRALAAVRAHAASDPTREVCGLLFGSDDRIDDAMAAPNVAADPMRHFEIDPAALFPAIRAERVGGPKVAGYYHSHPNGPAEPSATDEAMASRDGKLWLIVTPHALTGWRAGPDGFAAVAIG